MEPVIRTRATLRSAEFGFFGVVVYTRVHTPRRCGAATFFLRPLPDFRPGVESFFGLGLRPLRMSWLVVGMRRTMLAGRRRSSGRRDGLERVARGRVLEPLLAGHGLVCELPRRDVQALEEAGVGGQRSGRALLGELDHE